VLKSRCPRDEIFQNRLTRRLAEQLLEIFKLHSWPNFFKKLSTVETVCGSGEVWQIISCMFFDVFFLDMHSRYPQLMAACWFFDKPLSWELWGILFGCYLREYGCEKHINKIPLSFSSGYFHSTWLKLLQSPVRGSFTYPATWTCCQLIKIGIKPFPAFRCETRP